MPRIFLDDLVNDSELLLVCSIQAEFLIKSFFQCPRLGGLISPDGSGGFGAGPDDLSVAVRASLVEPILGVEVVSILATELNLDADASSVGSSRVESCARVRDGGDLAAPVNRHEDGVDVCLVTERTLDGIVRYEDGHGSHHRDGDEVVACGVSAVTLTEGHPDEFEVPSAELVHRSGNVGCVQGSWDDALYCLQIQVQDASFCDAVVVTAVVDPVVVESTGACDTGARGFDADVELCVPVFSCDFFHDVDGSFELCWCFVSHKFYGHVVFTLFFSFLLVLPNPSCNASVAFWRIFLRHAATLHLPLQNRAS